MKFLCKIFDHKWYNLTSRVRECKRCGKRQKLSPYSAARHTWVDNWKDIKNDKQNTVHI